MPSPRGMLRTVARWHIDSQQRSRRNAMLASTALVDLRRERDEVDSFLEAHARRWEVVQVRRAASV